MGQTRKQGEEDGNLKLRIADKEYTFERTEKFTYLGVIVEENGHGKQEIRARTTKGTMYACETWVLNKEEEERLRKWESRMLRAIYGGIKTEEGWRRRTNQEIEELYERPDIIACEKGQRIGWLGHLERMDAVRLPKMIIYRRPIGKKRKGKRWMNEVEKDLRDMKLGSWRETARNRGEWKKIVKEALKRRW
ncbi:hypothetical protein RI129_007270 [Pyrocoelia pectoralis]|uniref:Uncharacterized protein n=1 Tax=Pyrocoelia pectoralis TaxID=417401 RepID=A0AAN7V7Q7_9COLE